MTFVVPSIVEVLMNKIALWISISVNDWTAESEIISNNEGCCHNIINIYFTAEFANAAGSNFW